MTETSEQTRIVFRAPYGDVAPDDVIGVGLYDSPIYTDDRTQVGEVIDARTVDGGVHCMATVATDEAVRAERLTMGVVPQTIDCTITVDGTDESDEC